MGKLWEKYSIIIQIGIWIFCAGMTYDSFATHEKRITALENINRNQGKAITRMDYNIQIIAQKIGVQPLKTTDDQ